MKKWTFLVASAMLVGATPVFTGCIDNDEPEGISVLRGAKAELLKAKASVEAAKVAQIQADAALTLAQAEIQKAEAARIKAIADYESAKALEQQYLAELQNIKNEEQRADLENKIKIYAEERAQAERDAKEAAAALEASLVYWKGELAKQQAAYEVALKDLALAKTTLTEKQKTYLTKWTTALDNAKTKVETKSSTLESAIKTLATLTKTMEETEAKESYLRVQNKDIADAEKSLKSAQEARDLAKEYTEKQIAAADKWEEQMLALKAELDVLDKTLADLAVQKTQLEMDTKEDAVKVGELRNTYTELTGYTWNSDKKEFDEWIGMSKEPIDLKKVVVNINEPALGIYQDRIIEGSYRYSEYLNALKNGYDFIPSTLRQLNTIKKTIERSALDANGKALTEESIIIYKKDLKDATKSRDELKGQWELVVKAYKGLETGDASVLPGFDKVEEAVVKYNAAAKQYNVDKEAYETFKLDKLQAATKAHQDALDKIDADFRTARETSEKKYDATYAKIQSGIEALKLVRSTAAANYQKVLAKYNMIEEPTAADDKLLADALETQTKAEEAVDKATKEANGYMKDDKWIVGSIVKAQTLKSNELNLAESEVNLAKAKEFEAWFKVNPNNALEQENNRLSAIASESFSTLYTEISGIRDNILSNFYAETGLEMNYDGIYNLLSYDEEKGYNVANETTAKDLAVITKGNLSNRIMELSRSLYGNSHIEQLVELTAEEINAEIKQMWVEQCNNDNVDYSYYIRNYSKYGQTGEVLALEAKIEHTTAYLNNADVIKAHLKTINAEIEDVQAQIDAYTTDVVEPAEKAYTSAFEVLDAKFTAINDEISQAKADKYAKKPVLDKINDAIKVYLSQEMKPDGTPVMSETIEALRKELNDIYDTADADVYTKETTLIHKKEAKQAVIDGTKQPVAAQKEIVEDAQKEFETAQAELKAASEALQAEIERISTVE